MRGETHIEALAANAWLAPEVADVVEPLLAARPDLHDALASNEHLTRATWYRLWPARPRPAAGICSALAGRRLDEAQRRWVLDHDTRAGTLKALIRANRLDPDEQKLLLASKGAPGAVAEMLLSQSWADPCLARQTSEAAGGWTYLMWLAGSSPLDVPDSEVSAFLAGYPAWEPAKIHYSERSASLKKLLARRPQCLAVAVAADQHEAVITSAAGSRHLTDPALQYAAAGITPGAAKPAPGSLASRKYALLALVNNPVCHQEVLSEVERQLDGDTVMSDVVRAVRHRRNMKRPTVTDAYEDVADPEVLNWLVRRARPASDLETGRSRPGQVFDLPALAANPHLDALLAEDVARGLSGWAARENLDDDEVAAAYAKLIDRFPEIHPPKREVAPETFAPAEERTREEELTHTLRGAAQSAGQSCRMQAAYTPTGWMYYVEAELGTNATAWESFLGLVDSFEGTFAELAEIAKAL